MSTGSPGEDDGALRRGVDVAREARVRRACGDLTVASMAPMPSRYAELVGLDPEALERVEERLDAREHVERRVARRADALEAWRAGSRAPSSTAAVTAWKASMPRESALTARAGEGGGGVRHVGGALCVPDALRGAVDGGASTAWLCGSAAPSDRAARGGGARCDGPKRARRPWPGAASPGSCACRALSPRTTSCTCWQLADREARRHEVGAATARRIERGPRAAAAARAATILR